jgi:hypothetical protein
MVLDVWRSQQAFDTFGGMLMPILQEIGVDSGSHTVEPVHSRVPVTPSG